MTRRLLAVAAASLVTVSAGAQEIAAGAADCFEALERAGPAADAAEVPLVVDYCPGLVARINTGRWGEILGKETVAWLTAEGLALVAELDARYAAPPRVGAVPVEGLGDVLAELEDFAPPPAMTLWDQLMAFLQDLLGVEQGDAGWLVDWITSLSIPEWWQTALLYVLAGAIIAGAALIVVNELRRSGILGRTRAGEAFADRPLGLRSARPRIGLDAIRRAPLAQQPLLLLGVVLEALGARRGEDLREDLTHRELIAAVHGMPGVDAGAFGRVAGAAERVTYAGWRPSQGDLESVWSSSVDLVERAADPIPDRDGDPGDP